MLKTGTSLGVSYLETKRPYAMEFSVLDQEEILKSSVVEIKNERIYEQGWLYATLDGVNDPRMGVVDRDSLCMTCKGSQVDCSGHFGHIELARPMYHHGFLELVRKILKCGKVLYPRDKDQIESIKRVRNSKHRFNQIFRACEKYAIRNCESSSEGCGMRQPKFFSKGLGIEVEYLQEGKNDSCGMFMEQLGYQAADKRQTVWPEDVLRVFSRISLEQQNFLGIKKPQNLILRRLLVAPPSVRPSVSMGGPMKSEDDLTYAYQMILKSNNYIAMMIRKGANPTTINELRRNLQFYVATLMNNQIPGQPCQRHKSGKPLKAITQRLKGKEGRVRGNLMGKRVDFSARSVITPDPNLQLDQLGVPIRIAENITIPVVCTPHNIDELRQLICNGPARYPGAKYIIRHDDRQIDLGMLVNRSDAHLEYGYTVERHLMNGDYVVFNRQPSLHKMSAMGHRVRVLPYSTFRLNLSVTTPYNADFDGDEMNMFVPQGYEAMAEVKELMAVPNQIVSPQANKPVMGIVQDSLLGIMLLTRRDCFIDKKLSMNLMMWLGENNNDKSLPMPAIIKPRPLWTGKQILSLVLPNVNMVRYLEAPPKSLNAQWCSPNDTVVVIERGELYSGYLSKTTVGSSQQGLVHVIWRECGPQAAKNFLTNTQTIVNQWLIQHGFTVGVQDAIATKQTMQNISEKLDYYEKKVYKIIDKAEKGKLKFQPGKNLLESFEAKVNNQLNVARDEAGQLVFKNLDPQNKIQNMVSAGSKGTNINISQIMGCVGQQNVEGKRIPFGFKQRSLPHFVKHDYGPESKGFVKSNYQCGLYPTEFFFHAMGGREGLIDTAVKTSETGYIQRRLVKALEDVIVKYDCSVRNSNEQIIQFLYGEDGMAGENIEDVKIDLLKMSNQELEQRFNFIPGKSITPNAREYLKKSLIESEVDEVLENPAIQLQLMNEMKQIMRDREELRIFILKNKDEQIHVPVNIGRLINNCVKQFGIRKDEQTKLRPMHVIESVNKLIKDLTVFPGRTIAQTNSFYAETNANSTVLFKTYLRQELFTKRIIQQERLSQASFDWLLGEIKSRFEGSLVHPGETVGSLAAHSLGEPATQMTLNTFHFAGVSSKNVTLGVPRLKEVINVAKTIATPMVSIYLSGKKKNNQKEVIKLQGDIEHTTFSDILKNTSIFYDPDPTKTVIREDEALVALYNEVPDSNTVAQSSPWVLRFTLDPKKVISRTLDMDFINRKLLHTFNDQISVMCSDINDENLVIRMRFHDVRDDQEIITAEHLSNDYETAVMFLKEIEDNLIHDLTLKGIKEISKVYAKKYNEIVYDPQTGAPLVTSENWMLETDGVALQKILAVKRVDFKRTVSNDINEILTVLGVEAVRQALINELRVVLNFYGIYVNYRHIATLCDVMCQKGRLTSITRHGINRLDSGPLRKCSFEETVDVFLDASAYNEIDYLTGITESIILGMTAPYGTGSFDLSIDPDVLREFAQSNADEDLAAGGTPILEEFDENNNPLGSNTDYMSRTPDYYRGGQTSEYGRTPGGGGQSQYEAGFSPGYLQSPNYTSPNPYNSPGSPNYKPSPVYMGGIRLGGGIYGDNRFQSPIYQAAYQSPIYQPGSDGLVSPGKVASPHTHNQTAGSGYHMSPTYSPNQVTSAVNSPYLPDSQRQPYSPSYTGQKAKGHLSPVSSPSLVGNSPASPSYSPPPGSIILGSHHRSNTNSPAYSPTVTRMGAGQSGHMSQSSPNYSPTAMHYSSIPGVPYQGKPSYSPSYSPTTTPQFVGSGSSPKYVVSSRISPKYSVSAGGSSDLQIQSSVGSPKIGGGSSSHHENSVHGAFAGGSIHEGSGEGAKTSSLYIPSAVPKYNPTGGSPAYNSTRVEQIQQQNVPVDTSRMNLYDPTRTNSNKPDEPEKGSGGKEDEAVDKE